MPIIPTPVRPITPAILFGTDYDAFRGRYPAFVAELHAARQHRDHELAKLRGLADRDRHARVRKLLRDRGLHVLYAYHALRKTRQLGAATPDVVRSLAVQWNPFEVCRERTNMFNVPGRLRERRVVSFGPQRRMHQGLVSQIIRALHPPLESQKLFRGGMPKALEAVEVAITDGYVYGAEVDVIHFYAGIRYSEELAKLLRPLPASVVKHVVWDTGIRRNPDDDFMSVLSSDDPSLNGLVGLAPGAATSPIVGERIIGEMLAGDRDIRLVAYADNVFVLGRTADDVVTCIQHLRNNAEGLATGPLRIRAGDVQNLIGRSDVAQLPTKFTFLHHSGQIDRRVDDVGPALQVSWSPDQRKLDEYRLAENEATINADMIGRVERKVSQWRRAYPSWPNGDLWERRYLAELAALRFYKDPQPMHEARAANDLLLCYFAEGETLHFEEIAPAGHDEADWPRRERLIAAARQRLATVHARRIDQA